MDAAPEKPDVPKDVAEALESLQRLMRRYGTIDEREALVAARAVLSSTDVEPSIAVIDAFERPIEEKPARAAAQNARGRRRGPKRQERKPDAAATPKAVETPADASANGDAPATAKPATPAPAPAATPAPAPAAAAPPAAPKDEPAAAEAAPAEAQAAPAVEEKPKKPAESDAAAESADEKAE